MTQILVTKPGTLTPADKGKLRKAGIVCVESATPSDVRLISAEGPTMAGGDLAFAAITALAQTKDDSMTRYAKERFVHLIAKILEDQRADAA